MVNFAHIYTAFSIVVFFSNAINIPKFNNNNKQPRHNFVSLLDILRPRQFSVIWAFFSSILLIKGMLPTLHHGVNQSRLDYQSMDNGRGGGNNQNANNNSNNNHTMNSNNLDTSDSRLNKSRLLDYNNMGPMNYSNEHLLISNQQHSKAQNKYGSDYSHLPHIRQND
jgi:hypothetical protein